MWFVSAPVMYNRSGKSLFLHDIRLFIKRGSIHFHFFHCIPQPPPEILMLKHLSNNFKIWEAYSLTLDCIISPQKNIWRRLMCLYHAKIMSKLFIHYNYLNILQHFKSMDYLEKLNCQHVSILVPLNSSRIPTNNFFCCLLYLFE